MIKDVLMIGNPVLVEKSADVSFEDEPLLDQILADLGDTLTHLQDTKKIGRALSAPQLGYLKKVIYFQMKDKSFYMLNPEIIEKKLEMQVVWDSCYSFDVAFFIRIPRHEMIKVIYYDESGHPHSEEFTGEMSELVQHEIDHLQGVLAVEHMAGTKGNIIMRAEWETRYRKTDTG